MKLKKLKLSRETLRHLGQHDLREVAGGATFLQCSGTCTKQFCSVVSYCYQCQSFEASDCPDGCTGTTCV